MCAVFLVGNFRSFLREFNVAFNCIRGSNRRIYWILNSIQIFVPLHIWKLGIYKNRIRRGFGLYSWIKSNEEAYESLKQALGFIGKATFYMHWPDVAQEDWNNSNIDFQFNRTCPHWNSELARKLVGLDARNLLIHTEDPWNTAFIIGRRIYCRFNFVEASNRKCQFLMQLVTSIFHRRHTRDRASDGITWLVGY